MVSVLVSGTLPDVRMPVLTSEPVHPSIVRSLSCKKPATGALFASYGTKKIRPEGGSEFHSNPLIVRVSSLRLAPSVQGGCRGFSGPMYLRHL